MWIRFTLSLRTQTKKLHVIDVKLDSTVVLYVIKQDTVVMGTVIIGRIIPILTLESDSSIPGSSPCTILIDTLPLVE